MNRSSASRVPPMDFDPAAPVGEVTPHPAEAGASGLSRRALMQMLVVGVAAPWLAGCASRQAAPRIVDLGVAPAWSGPMLPRRVDVQWVSGSDLTQGTGIAYRLEYSDPYTRRSYRDSRWAAPIPTLVATRLRQLASRAAPEASPDGAVPVALTVEVEDIVQRFSSPTASELTVRLGAGVGGGNARRAGAQKTFELTLPAGGDADGAVRALAQALDQLGPRLLSWAAATA